MKFCAAVNHASPFHVGGSEKVIQQISESMKKDYGHNSVVLTKYTNKESCYFNGVNLIRTASNAEDFLDQLISLNIDHLMVYSDCFSYWPAILKKSDQLPFSKSICLVGMNKMLGDKDLQSLFLEKSNNFKIITHSDNYQDYLFCKSKNIKTHVIPNGIDFSEFKNNNFSFKRKYNVLTNKMILCVSNFFPGKGQEYLISILNKVYERFKDFTMVFICSTVSFYVANNLMNRFCSMLQKNAKFKYILLKDIPREDTIQSFLESDIFVFPSQQEVAPLVLLESMASRTPWISLNVGNTSSLSGGLVINASKKVNGQFVYDESIFKSFENNILDLLIDDNRRIDLGNIGYKYCFDHFNWDNIKINYHKIFNDEI